MENDVFDRQQERLATPLARSCSEWNQKLPPFCDFRCRRSARLAGRAELMNDGSVVARSRNTETVKFVELILTSSSSSSSCAFVQEHAMTYGTPTRRPQMPRSRVRGHRAMSSHAATTADAVHLSSTGVIGGRTYRKVLQSTVHVCALVTEVGCVVFNNEKCVLMIPRAFSSGAMRSGWSNGRCMSSNQSRR